MNDEFEKNLQRHLHDSEEQLSGEVRSKLHQARTKALAEAEPKKSGWALFNNPYAFSSASVAAFALVTVVIYPLVNNTQPMPMQSALLDDTQNQQPNLSINEVNELVADIDLYEDLEFYQWLAETDQAG